MKFSPAFLGFDVIVGEPVPIQAFLAGVTHVTNISLVKGNKAVVKLQVEDIMEEEELIEFDLEVDRLEKEEGGEGEEEEKKEGDEKVVQQVQEEVEVEIELQSFQIATLNEHCPDKLMNLKFGSDEMPIFTVEGEEGTVVHIVGYCELIESELEDLFELGPFDMDEDEVIEIPEKLIEEVGEVNLKKRMREGDAPEQPELKKKKAE